MKYGLKIKKLYMGTKLKLYIYMYEIWAQLLYSITNFTEVYIHL
jgi:hypothetical protein